METNIILHKTGLRNSHYLLISGLIFLTIGFVLIMSPVGFFIAISILFSLGFLAAGTAEIWSGISSRDRHDTWGWPVARGVLAMIMGIVLLVKPEISMIILPFVVGCLVLLKSVGIMGWSLLARDYGSRAWRWILASGILGGILALTVIMNPGFTGLVIAVFAALSFIVIGLLQIWFAFRLRKLS